MMNKNTEDVIELVEYTPKYAQAVAAMWNCSQESWGGGSRIRSGEEVDQELRNAGNLKVFLALDGDEVVGYCSFSQYQFDEGALYVPLLNVRPDYHGRKIGRMLILQAVKTTVEMGWPRLDLFTWAGNTKAVPMYKKCGFFWEKKEDAVHLMNYMPSVLKMEALQPYLEKLDWYADSKRVIEICPDGRTENGFDFLEYVWEKDDIRLKVEFEKTGRGICLIDTPDYTIHTLIEDHNLVFGGRYPVRYEIRNKTGKPLLCAIKGRDDKNIRFGLEQTIEVSDSHIVEGEFELMPVHEEQSDWKTHPAVVSDWRINGKSIELRMGVAPLFPAKMKLEVKPQEQYLGVREEALVSFENNYPETTVFEFEFPSSGFIKFDNPMLSVEIPAKGKIAVSVPYVLNDFGLFSEDMVITARCGSLPPISFTTRLWGLFKGLSGRYGGDITDHWIAVNGPYSIGLNKNNNELWASHFLRSHHTSWTFPRVGKPYSLEFSKKKAEQVRIFAEGDVMVLEADYQSEDFPGVSFTSCNRLNAVGIVERYFEFREPGVSLGEDIRLIDGFYHHSEGLVLPYDGHYYDLKDQYAANYNDWEIDRISENWLFSRHEKCSHGFCWDPEAKLVKSEWHLGIEYQVGRMPSGETVRSGSTFQAIGTFSDWWDFRSYACKRRDRIQPLLKNHIELSVNDGNPFATHDADLHLNQHRNQPLTGELTLSFPISAREAVHDSFRREDSRQSGSYKLMSLEPGTVEQVRMVFEAEELSIKRSTVLVPLSGQPVQQEIRGPEGEPTFTCSNGVLTIEAAPSSFGAALHSLVHNGEEWLDSSYPAPGPRSWWNPWHGGISAGIQGVSPLSQQEEKREADFVSLMDNRGNSWSGLKLRTCFEKLERSRGMELDLYALLLPGAPVLCCVTRLSNRTGMSYNQFHSSIGSFFTPGGLPDQGWMEANADTRYRCGKTGTDIRSEGIVRIGSDSRSTILHAVNRYPGSGAQVYTNNLVIHHSASQSSPLPAQSEVWSAPVFFVFAEKPLDYQDMRSFAEISFESTGR
ncbi:GNAT family N-acetyltransferase [Paenibacillus nasutitermitis]|uniref:N-acetyltransferase domain-containing protein n=1 Tax=Paenibacillus nasutitermitis TaxID=1652958 RepID=A0A916YRS5_9BACL|nr:GNAT family N-acetyltransferase [Paenibacillus nasutitermitis]GGD56916.1 hypothetical protein GCM10010911_13340 [Paenibacillus nasutitermitis]